MSMKSIVTGVGGFAGSHLAEYLLSLGHDVYGLLKPGSSRHSVSHMKNLHVYESDMTDYDSIFSPLKKHKPDYVFHLAAHTNVNYSFTNPSSFLFDNGLGAINILEAVRHLRDDGNYDPVVMFCSSSEVYGQVDAKDMPITEHNLLKPISPYAISKAYADMLAYQYWLSWKMKIIRTRAFSHTGIRRNPAFAVSGFARQIANIEAGHRDPVIHVGSLDSIRTFADVRDIVRAYWLAAKLGEYGEAYNICGNAVVSMREVLNELLSLSTCKDIKIVVDAERLRPSDITKQLADCTKFVERTGWCPQIDFKKDTLKDVLNYWRERLRSPS